MIIRTEIDIFLKLPHEKNASAALDSTKVINPIRRVVF